MEETRINLIDCIGSITQRPIAMDGVIYVYLDTKGVVEQSVLDEAVLLKNEKDALLIQDAFTKAIQAHMDAKAKERGYDNIVSACSYAGYENTFRVEGEAYGIWRASCWHYAYAQLGLILSAERSMPTIEAFIAELPVLVLP